MKPPVNKLEQVRSFVKTLEKNGEGKHCELVDDKFGEPSLSFTRVLINKCQPKDGKLVTRWMNNKLMVWLF
jgi:hypothetical protein